MTTTCEDVLPSLLDTCTEGRGRRLRFELFDCRTRAEFASKHVEGSHHLDPAAHRRASSVTSRGGLVALVRSFNDVPSDDIHLCFFAGACESALEDDDVGGDLFALEYAVLFIQRGFRHVSVLADGFPALAAALERDGVHAVHGIYPVALAQPSVRHSDTPEPEHRPDSHQAHEALHALQHRTAQLGSTIRAAMSRRARDWSGAYARRPQRSRRPLRRSKPLPGVYKTRRQNSMLSTGNSSRETPTRAHVGGLHERICGERRSES